MDTPLGDDSHAQSEPALVCDDILGALDVVASEVDSVLSALVPRVLCDDDLTSLVSVVERLGRVVDAARVASAGEVGERSRSERGDARLSARRGCRSAGELLQRLTGVSGQTASRRLLLGRETYQRMSFAGHEAPPRFAAVATALAEGSLGLDAASVIVKDLSAVIGRCQDELWFGAEAELVAAAVECTADETRIQAVVWKAVLDPDGVEPSEERSMRRRFLRLSGDGEGMMRVSGLLMPTAAAQLTKLLDAYLTPRTPPAFRAVGERRSPDVGVEDVVRDRRSLDQQRHDVFVGLVDCAARSAETASVGGAPPSVLVMISEAEWRKGGAARSTGAGAVPGADANANANANASANANAGADTAAGVRAGSGVGVVEGVDVPVSVKTVRQYACSGGVQPVVLSGAGEVVALGSPQRCFTGRQRKAIMVRDGGCVIPGCMVPGSWCEIHHVVEAAAGGPTHTSNGVLLCWFHHRTIETSGWQVRMKEGAPQVKKPAWLASDATWQPSTKSLSRLITQARRRPNPT